MTDQERIAQLEKRIAELEKQVAAATTTADFSYMNQMLIPHVQFQSQMLQILYGVVGETRHLCGLPKEESSTEKHAEQAWQALRSQIHESKEWMDCYNRRMSRSERSSDRRKSV